MDLEVEPVTSTIGAVVRGVDLRQLLEPEVVDSIKCAVHEWMVLFFPGQSLTDVQHIRLAESFGSPNINPNSQARGITHPLEWIEDSPESPPKTDLWHTDVAFSPRPPDYAFLSHQVTPDHGGDTLWANLCAAYEMLSPVMQRFADTLVQEVHPGDGLKDTLRVQFGEGVWEKVTHLYQGTTHPLVRVHPDTGRKALFLCGAYFERIEGMTARESDALIELFRAPLNEPGIQCRWRWNPGDVAIWDERCTNHRGLGDHYPRPRMVRRCTVGASQPLGPT